MPDTKPTLAPSELHVWLIHAKRRSDSGPMPSRLRKGLERRLPRGGKFKDLTGRKYDRFQILGFAGYKGPFAAWLCQCRCGNLFVREGAYLAPAHRKIASCGCSKKSPVPEYLRVAWQSMIARCHNPRHQQYETYGKRGITVCKRWLNSVEKFAEDMGPRPSPRHVVARRNKRGNFTPNNCYWGTYRDRPLTRAREITHNG